MAKFEFETQANIGDWIYSIEKKSKTIYAPCKVCKNERQVEYKGDDGEIYIINCPRCSEKATKGDTSNSIVINNYSLNSHEVENIVIEGQGVYYRTLGHAKIDVITLKDRASYNQDKFYTLDKKEAQNEVKRLNSIEK